VSKASARQCSFCRKAQDGANRLVVGSHGVSICGECIEVCDEVIQQERAQHLAYPLGMDAGGLQAVSALYRCAFCGKTQEQVERLISRVGDHFICNECVDECLRLIHGQEGSHLSFGSPDSECWGAPGSA
jgi:ATP-dependent protease Clp ATPase subunit